MNNIQENTINKFNMHSYDLTIKCKSELTDGYEQKLEFSLKFEKLKKIAKRDLDLDILSDANAFDWEEGEE